MTFGTALVQRNIEELSCNHCCSVKTMAITQPVCVFVALVVVIIDFPVSTILLHINS